MYSGGIMSTKSRMLIELHVQPPVIVNQEIGMINNSSMVLFPTRSLDLHLSSTMTTIVMIIVNKWGFDGPKFTS